MKNFILSHLKLIIIIPCITIITIIGSIVVFNVINSNNNSIQSNKRDKDKIQIEVVADVVKIRESKEPNSQVVGNVYKNEIYSVISLNADLCIRIYKKVPWNQSLGSIFHVVHR